MPSPSSDAIRIAVPHGVPWLPRKQALEYITKRLIVCVSATLAKQRCVHCQFHRFTRASSAGWAQKHSPDTMTGVRDNGAGTLSLPPAKPNAPFFAACQVFFTAPSVFSGLQSACNNELLLL
jgi:hypothetical protein